MFKRKPKEPEEAVPARGFDHIYEQGSFARRAEDHRPATKGQVCLTCGCLPDECRGEKR